LTKNIIATTSVSSIGATFVDWSINFLSGQETHYNFRSGQHLKLTHSPLTKLFTAHGHQKNHPIGFDETQTYIAQFLHEPGDLFTLYPFPRHKDLIAKDLGIDTASLTPDQYTNIIKATYQDFGKIIAHCFENQVRVIYINLDPSLVMYANLNVRSLDRLAFSNVKPASVSDVHNHIQKIFFNDSVKTWQNLELVNHWDVRERLALDTRPLDDHNREYLTSCLNLSKPHCWVDTRELWHHGETVLKNILDFCDLPINNQRLTLWLPVYQEWQKQQLKLVDFVYHYQYIVDAIVNNWDYKFNDLTFEQEVAIQHLLIYKHGLNLKTWQLDKFPANAQDLHKLLEPNFHPIQAIY